MLALSVLTTVALALSSHAAPKRNSWAAAAYSISNEPTGNYVIATYITASGTMAYGSAISTGGYGGHGVNPGAGDGLFSQDSVKVWGDYLFTVNAGSNTVVAFKIDSSDPGKLHMIGSPVPSAGEFPVSIAVSPAGEICVLNGGKIAGVSCYWLDEYWGLRTVSGSTRALALNQTTPPTGPPNTVSDIVFNADGSQLVVSVKGTPPSIPGYLATWTVKADGSLSSAFVKSTISGGGLLPFSLTRVAGKNALLNTDPAVGYIVWDVSKTPFTPTVFPVTGQKAICWSEYSSKTGSYYLIDAGASLVTEITISNSTHSNIVKQYTLAVGSGPIDSAVATIGGYDFLVILASGKTGIDILELRGRGQAFQVASLNITAIAPPGVKISSTNLQGMAVWIA